MRTAFNVTDRVIDTADAENPISTPTALYAVT